MLEKAKHRQCGKYCGAESLGRNGPHFLLWMPGQPWAPCHPAPNPAQTRQTDRAGACLHSVAPPPPRLGNCSAPPYVGTSYGLSETSSCPQGLGRHGELGEGASQNWGPLGSHPGSVSHKLGAIDKLCHLLGPRSPLLTMGINFAFSGQDHWEVALCSTEHSQAECPGTVTLTHATGSRSLPPAQNWGLLESMNELTLRNSSGK